MEKSQENTSKQVVYSKAKKYRRFLAFMTDAFILVLSTFLLFGAAHQGVRNLPFHQEQSSIRNEIRLSSGLYVKNGNGDIVSIVSYVKDNTEYPSAITKKNYLSPRIDTFYTMKEFVGDGELLGQYEVRKSKATRDNVHLFITVDGKIVENSVNPTYLYEFYADEISSYCNGYLLRSSRYVKTTSVIFLTVVVEVLIYVTLMFAIFYVIIPLFAFKRGRKTLGRASFRIGLVANNALNVSTKRFLVRCLFEYVVMLLLNFFAVFIPLVISLFLVLFSKNSQGLVDYVVGIHQVDVTVDDIYLDYGDYLTRQEKREEASIENNDYKIGGKHI